MHTHARSALIAVTLIACGSPAAPAIDAAVTTDAAATVDATMATDAPASFVLYAPCVTAADCHGGADAICNDIFPGGMCTVPCTADSDCGDDACWRGYCRPTCTADGGECAQWQGACVRPSDARSRCTTACDAIDPPPGTIPCNEGLVCNPYAGNCADPSTTPTGAENGAPCTTAADCRGNVCLSEIDATTGQPTGWLGGACVSLGIQPPDDAFVTGEPSPSSNCPEGSVVLLRGGTTAVGDVTLCIDECTDASDCRAGYQCVRGDGSPTRPYPSTGACYPVFCDIPGMECPAGTTCVIHGGLSQCETT